MINSSTTLKQQGFSILAVILVIVAVIVAIGIWAFSGQTNTSTSASSTADVLANSLVSDAASIKLAYDKLIINGANYNNIVFVPNTSSSSSAPNVLDPVDGIQLPKISKNAIRTAAGEPEGIWVYIKNFSVSYVGDRLVADPSIIVAGVTDAVCQRINFNLYGTTNIPSLSGFPLSSMFVPGATSNNPNTTLNMSNFTPETMYRTSGCVSASGVKDNNLYYFVLKAV